MKIYLQASFLFVAIFSLCNMHAAHADNVPITAAIASFDSTNINAFQLNGTATLTGSNIRLTPNVGDSAGSAFWIHKVSLSNDRSFSAYFTFVITGPQAGGADGIVFTIQPNSNDAGSVGGGIGFDGIENSFGVEIDTWDNGVGAGDPNANHIGIDLNGSVNSVTTVNLGDISGFNGSSHFDDGGTYHMWIDYNGSTDTLEVRLTENTDVRPVSAALTYSVDLATIFAEDVFVGFTAATGGADENHDITSFYFNNDFISEGIDPDTNTYESLPFQVNLEGTPLTVSADGTSTIALTATVADVSDAGLVGQTVTFTTDNGTLTSDSGITNGSGVVTNTITAPAFSGTATIRASVEGGAYDEITVTFVEIDSDGDGLDDGTEFLVGTNPHDRGSYLQVQAHKICSHWNGYLGNVANVYEEIDNANFSALLTNTMYDIAGTSLGSLGIFLQPNQEYDLLVHDQSGFSQSNYGAMCFSYPNVPAAIESRMIHYKAANGYTFSDLQFDLAIPFEGTGGKTGEQDTLFNTYHPSWDLSEANDNLANWIIVTNISDDAQGGTLTFFDSDGTELSSQHEDFAANAERHFAAHELGANRVGLVRWVPDDNDAKFSVHSVRYAYDNAQWNDSFFGGVALDGRRGNGQLIAVPVDAENSSAILEIGNTLDSAVTAVVTVYSAAGNELDERTVNLPAHGTHHLILDDILNGAAGVATIDGSAAESIIAYALQYGRPGLTYMYMTAAEELGGNDRLGGTYNSNLEQGCTLVLVNGSGSPVDSTIALYERDGDTVDAPSFTDSVTIPAHGSSTLDVCSEVAADTYGTVVVENDTSHAIVGTMIRIGAPTAHSYRFSTPLRYFGLVG